MPKRQHKIEVVVDGKNRLAGPLGALRRQFGALGGVLTGIVAIGGAAAAGFGALVAAGIPAAAKVQRLAVSMETLAAQEIKAAGGAETMAEALKMATPRADALLARLRDMAVASPFPYERITNTFRMTKAFGATSEMALDLTKAILDVSAGMGLANDQIQRIAYNFGQVIRTGQITARDIRDLALAGIDLADVFEQELGKSLETVQQEMKSGQLTAQEVSEAFIRYAEENFGGAAERMSRTFVGLKDSIRDVFTFAAADLLTPSLDAISDALGGVLDQAMGLIESGALERIGIKIGVITEEALKLGKAAVRAIGNFVKTLTRGLAGSAQNAFQWGVEISAQLASGLIEGASAFIVKAMQVIGDLLSGWLAPGSPPKVAPEIDQWGVGTMEEFFKGMANADFSALSTIQSQINRAFEVLISTGELSRKNANRLMIAITGDLAQAMKEFERTGSLAESTLNRIRDAGGQFGEQLVKLVKRQTALAQATQEVRKAEEELNEARKAEDEAQDRVRKLQDAYKELINVGAPKAIIKQKRAEIEAAEEQLDQAEKRRKQAAEEQDQARQRQQQLQKRLRIQEQLLSQLTKFAELQQKLAEGAAAGGVGGGGAGGTGGGPDLGGGGGGIGGVEKPDLTPDLGDLGNVGAQIDADKIASDFRKRLQEAFAPLREVGETWEKETGEIRTAWEENMAPIMSWVKGFLGLPLEAKLGVLNHHFEQLTGIDLAATFEKAKKAILPALELIGEALAELRDWFVEEVWPPLKDAWNEFTRVLKSFGVEWSDVWKTAKSVLAAVLWAIMVAILGVIGIVAALAKAVAETVKFVVNRFKEFKKGMERTGEGIKALVSGLWKVVKGIFSLNLKLIWEGIKQAGEGIWKTVTGVLMQIWTIIKTIVGGIGTLVGHFVVGLVEFFINLKERLTGETQQTLDDLKRQWIVFRIKVQIVVRRLWTQIKMFFVNLRADVKRITGNLVDGVTGFFKGLKSDLVGTEGFVSTLIRKMSGLWGSFKDLLTGGEESLISKIVRGVVGGFNDLKDKIVGENGIIPNLIQDVEDFFTEKDWAQLGKDIINGLAGGVESVVGTLVDAVKGAVSEAFQGGKDEAQAESPSRLFAPLGADMVGGMRRGVLGAAHELERAVRDTVRGSFRAGGSLPSAGGGGRGPVTIYGGVSISEAGNANDILEQLYDLSGR